MLTNRKKIYIFSFFWMFLVIMPVIGPFFLNLGLNMHEVFQLTAIFGVDVVALEIPTGYLCDLWGRKKTLIIGSFISRLGFTYLFYAKTFCWLASVSGESFAAVLGELLATFSFKHVLIAHALVGWVPFFIALTLHETPYEKMIHKNHWYNFRDVFRHLF